MLTRKSFCSSAFKIHASTFSNEEVTREHNLLSEQSFIFVFSVLFFCCCWCIVVPYCANGSSLLAKCNLLVSEVIAYEMHARRRAHVAKRCHMHFAHNGSSQTSRSATKNPLQVHHNTSCRCFCFVLLVPCLANLRLNDDAHVRAIQQE